MKRYDFRHIDMEHYARREHFNYFNSMNNPYVGLTCNVDITDFLTSIRRKGYPFFLSFLWCAALSANGVPEFRQRVFNGGIIEYESCPTSHTVAKPDGTYCYCNLDCRDSLDAFIPYAKREQQSSLSGGISEDADAALASFFISTLPWLTYTSLTQPTPCPADSNPRVTWGRYFDADNRVLMPVTVLCNHALVDGVHIAAFYAGLKDAMNHACSPDTP